MARRRNDVRLFLNSLPPSLCPARRVYFTLVSTPLYCLASILLAFVGLALSSKPGLPISRPPPHHPQHAFSFSCLSCPHNTALPALSTTTASMDGMDVTAASARYVVVIVWRPRSSPFRGAIAPDGSPARLLASPLLSDALRLPVDLMRCPV